MFKKFLNLIKSNKDEKNKKYENLNTDSQEESSIISEDEVVKEAIQEEIIKINENNLITGIINNDNNLDEEVTHHKKKINSKGLELEIQLNQEDLVYIKKIKMIRGKSIKAIDVYSKEEIIFNTHKECSKKLGVPVEYIHENLEYGYTDYFGFAINYLSKKLRVDIASIKEDGKNIVEIFNYLHNELWSENISEEKREDILSSDKIESIKMHYKFEMLDDEYDLYFEKYGKLIRRGGKKKIELIDKKNEVVDVFKSLDECAAFFKKDKSDIIDKLKYGECKIGRYEIRYSLTR